MWRAAKRAAVEAVRSAGRGSVASSSRGNAPDTRVSAIARVARDGANKGSAGKASATKGSGAQRAGCSSKQNPLPKNRDVRHDRPQTAVSNSIQTHHTQPIGRDQRRRSMHAEGLLELRHLWELEAAAARNIKRRANGEQPSATAFDMISALRHAGCSWTDIFSHTAVRVEASVGLAHVSSYIVKVPGAMFAPVESAARKSVQRLTKIVPTLALHAGGTWSDVVSHPAFKVLGRERNEVLKALFVAGPTKTIATGLVNTTRQLTTMKPGPRFPELTEEIATFISSSAALRHAGCSWLDVARHASFHACVRARVVAGGYSVYLATFVKHPFTTALVTSVTKCVASDIFVQKVIERKEEVDTKRMFCFFILGLTYVGAFQYGLYNRLMKPVGDVLTRKYGTGTSVGAMVFVDQLLVCPLLYLPAFFGLKTWANGECTALALPGTIIEKSKEALVGGAHAIEQMRTGKSLEIVPTSAKQPDSGWLTLFALWAYWVPAQAVNFWVVPRHLTIPFMNVMGFGWNGIMSAMNGERIGEGVDAKMDASKSEALDATRSNALLVSDSPSLSVPALASDASEFLSDERCVRALAMASSDALAIANVGVAGPEPMYQ